MEGNDGHNRRIARKQKAGGLLSRRPAGIHGLFRVVAGAQALVAVAAMAAAARSNLDAVKLAHVVAGMVLAAFHIAVDALIVVGERHRVHLPFL